VDSPARGVRRRTWNVIESFCSGRVILYREFEGQRMSYPVIDAACLTLGLVVAIASVAALLFFVTEVMERRIDTPPRSSKARPHDEGATLV
jgi:hypothetical protein